MPHVAELAIVVPGQAITIAALAAVLVALLVGLFVRKARHKKSAAAAWVAACDELGIEYQAQGSKLGPTALGRVNEHVVAIAPTNRGRQKQLVTQYRVKFEAPTAPEFALVKRIGSAVPVVETGNPKFDAVVAVQTDQQELLSRFLTEPRRAAILRLLTYFPTARITNREAQLLTVGIENDEHKIVDSVCHLVAAAETFDRPVPAADTPLDELPEEPAPGSPPDQSITNDADVLTELRLDEATVLSDLFDSSLDAAAMSARFEQVYRGRKVTWTGEVVRVGTSERGMRRVAAFIGSANGVDPRSGRVVALAAVKSEPVVTEGDVVSFSGALVNLDVTQRLFHVV